MTKVGEGKSFPEQPSIQNYQEQLDQNAIKFQKALEGYKEGNSVEKLHFKEAMDQALGLIRSAVQEIKRSGMSKQESLVEKDYNDFIKNESPANFSKLEENLSTLREYNKLD